jgi:hypothetical protein
VPADLASSSGEVTASGGSGIGAGLTGVRGADRHNDEGARKSQNDAYSHTTSAVLTEAMSSPSQGCWLPAFRKPKTGDVRVR